MNKNFKKRARRRRMIAAWRTIERTCAVCGKKMEIKFTPRGRPKNAYYFGKAELPVLGTGKCVETDETSSVLGDDVKVVKWTGEKKEIEYWECPECYQDTAEKARLEGIDFDD